MNNNKFQSEWLLWLSMIFIAMTITSTALMAQSLNKLATTEILGKEYYIYEAKKGESLYGVAKKYNWDIEELMRLNPEAEGNLHKGERLYYPTGKVAVVKEMPKPKKIDFKDLEPVNHKVKKGETIYSISRQYGVPLEIIYSQNPSTKKGVKPGDMVVIPQSGNSQYYYYTIKKGDTLSSIAQTYNSTVEDILKSNAGLTVTNMSVGETIRIPVNSIVGKVKTELIEEKNVAQITGYKVEKDESWDEISEKTGVEVEVLKEANNAEENPKEKSIVNVPVVETVEVEREIVYREPEEMPEEKVQEIYDSIKGNLPDENLVEGVRMALILDDPNSKKDIDFTRGVLVALAEMKEPPYKIDFNVIDGRISTGNLTDRLDEFEPNIIISTADKAFPLFLADYGNSNNIQIINVFDLKNDLYEDNSSMVQILPPSGYFNDRIATHIYNKNYRRKLVSVGDKDENDGIATELFKLYDGKMEEISLEEFGSLEPDIMEPVLIYSYANKKEEVSDFLKNVENLTDSYPGLDFRIVGRSSWISWTDDFSDQFEEYKVWIPSRVWMDENSPEWKKFISTYDEMFEGVPVRSIPNFAVSGFDIANYFIPIVAKNHGDFNLGINNIQSEGLQNDILLNRVNNWGGFINGIGYIIAFRPGGEVEKIIVK